jgi:hypothetical protein
LHNVTTPQGSATSAWLLRQAAPNQSITTPSWCRCPAAARLDELAEARRRLDDELVLLHQGLGIGAEPRDRQPAQSVPVQGTANGASRGTSMFWASPATRTATGENADRLQASRMAVHQHHLRAHRSPTTTSKPMKTRTSTPVPTHRRFSGGRPRTRLPQPCCCTAARNRQPRRSDKYASS